MRWVRQHIFVCLYYLYYRCLPHTCARIDKLLMFRTICGCTHHSWRIHIQTFGPTEKNPQKSPKYHVLGKLTNLFTSGDSYLHCGLGWVRGDYGPPLHNSVFWGMFLGLHLRAPQQGIAIQQSDSSEYSFPRLQILNRNGPYNMVWMQLQLPDLRKASRPTIFDWFVL